jgi:hypothetical protein
MVALILNDRVKEETTTEGTITLVLGGAVTGFETFVAGVGTTNSTYYSCVHKTVDEWEVGIGVVTDATPDTLSRTTVFSSSNSDSKVDFAAGTKDVFCTYPASKAPSASMDPTEYVTSHAVTISDDQTLASAVLAGPVSITGTQTVTGNLIIL